jgi:hypothetical protein
MIITSFDIIRDGGSVSIQTDEGLFVVDGRMATITPGKVFRNYPKKDGSNIVVDEQVLVNLDEAVKASPIANYSLFVAALNKKK